MLYITTGDGGSGDDQDCQIDFDGLPTFGHPGPGNGQNLSTPLGKILRIDPRTPSGGRGYTIPPTNPFVPSLTNPDVPEGALGEIWAYGLRNPFRASFDGTDLWVGDVGQNSVEEVDLIVRGGNYGWRLREGGFGFDPAGFDTHGFESDGFVVSSPPGPGVIDPVAQYDHDDGTAVIGGEVYRGSSMPSLVGTYVFGDTPAPEQPARPDLRGRRQRCERLQGPGRRAEGRPHRRSADRLGPGAQRELYALIMERDLEGGRVLRVGQKSP